MVATMIIELGLAVWIVTRYLLGSRQRLIVVLLVLLAGFQLAEFNVCGSEAADILSSRLGYIFITLLPAIGVDLVVRLRQEKRYALVLACYAMALAFVAAFAFVPQSVNQGVCEGNYVIFALKASLSSLYGFYYFGLEFLGLGLALLPMEKPKANLQRSLYWMAAGYVSIIAPTLIIVVMLPATHVAIPSIMCGFAVIFALILGLGISPAISKSKP